MVSLQLFRIIFSYLAIGLIAQSGIAADLSADREGFTCKGLTLHDSTKIRFSRDSTNLTAESKKVIAAYARILRDSPDERMDVLGYVSQGYGQSFALGVSQRLAVAVARELVSLNVPESQVRHVGLGQINSRLSKRGNVLLKLSKTNDGSNNKYWDINIEIGQNGECHIVIPQPGETDHSH